MPEEERVGELQRLDAVATERDMLLAFRACEDSTDLEPVFMQITAVDDEGGDGVAVVSIADSRGFSLGRYLIPRERLDEALGRTSEAGAPAVVPTDW